MRFVMNTSWFVAFSFSQNRNSQRVLCFSAEVIHCFSSSLLRDQEHMNIECHVARSNDHFLLKALNFLFFRLLTVVCEFLHLKKPVGPLLRCTNREEKQLYYLRESRAYVLPVHLLLWVVSLVHFILDPTVLMIRVFFLRKKAKVVVVLLRISGKVVCLSQNFTEQGWQDRQLLSQWNGGSGVGFSQKASISGAVQLLAAGCAKQCGRAVNVYLQGRCVHLFLWVSFAERVPLSNFLYSDF